MRLYYCDHCGLMIEKNCLSELQISGDNPSVMMKLDLHKTCRKEVIEFIGSPKREPLGRDRT